METLLKQLTSRDAALLTWIGVGLLALAWSMVHGRGVGRSALSVIRAFFAPRIVGMVALVASWLILLVLLAARIDIWTVGLLKDTIVIITFGAFMAGFRALAVMNGEATMRDEVQSVIALVVVIQFVANLQTLPYLLELVLLPTAALLGGIQAVANHSDEHRAARPVINGTIMLLGVCILAWSLYKIASSLGSTEWETVGRAFALAFWLPAAVIPAIYAAALAMQYGKIISMMKIVRPLSLGARLDLYWHYGLNLRGLSAFSRARGRAHEYVRAESRRERTAILRATTD